LLSMWLSNVAAAVLLLAVVRPVLREMPQESDWPKMVLLGIAFSCNLGGMASPIASPQNVIAVSALHNAGIALSFYEWCIFAVPFCTIGLGIVWGILRLGFKTRLPHGIDSSGFSVVALPKLGALHAFIIGTVLATVALWCVFDSIAFIFGNMGIIALLPIVLFHGTGVLTLVEFNSMPWNVLMLMGGGLALGNAVQSSGLLDIIADSLQAKLAGHGLWLTFFVFNVFTAIMANFLSSTVCAIIMMPVIAHVGASLGHARMMVVGVAVMTSGAMMLPVSSFPNANSSTLNNAEGQAFLNNRDYLRVGFPVTLSLLTVLSTAGYAFFMLLGW